MFAAMLDTCVLWPSLRRDFVLSTAVEGLYRPLWSEAILEELEFHEIRKLVDRHAAQGPEAGQAADLIRAMRETFDDALVTGWERLEGTFGLPGLDDEHVVAAAVVGGAGVIVTDNLKDFPRGAIPAHIQVASAAQFCADTVSVAPAVALRAIEKIAARYTRPPVDVDELLDELVRRYDMDEAVDMLRNC